MRLFLYSVYIQDILQSHTFLHGPDNNAAASSDISL